MKVLIIEDERRMARLLRMGLSEEGHSVACAYNGAEGLAAARDDEFDVIVLDLMLPKMNGFDVAEHLRAERNHTPILMLTARDAVPDVVRGLDLGADEYMTKPFSFPELLARLKAVRRPSELSLKRCLRIADLELDLETRKVRRSSRRIPLSRTEYALLERLMHTATQVVSRQALIEAAWGIERPVDANNLEAFIHRLREKIDGPGLPKLIRTVRGSGYIVGPDNLS